MKKLRRTSSRRRFVKSAAAGAAIAPFFIGNAKATDQIVVDLASVAPKDTPWYNSMLQLKRGVKKSTEERMKVRIFPGGGKGDEVSTVEACKQGRIQMVGASIGALATQAPEIGCFEAPFLFDSSKQAEGVMQNARQKIHDLLYDRGFKLAFLSENGFRSMGCTFPIEKLEDIKGAKMRSQQSDIHKWTYEHLGANPVLMSVGEVFASLQTGVVDGCDNTPLFMFAAAWYMAITHYTVTRHIYQPAAVVWSRKFWDTLDPELQKALEPSGDEFKKIESRGFRNLRLMAPQLLENFRAAGKVVIEPDRTELARWKSATAPVHEKFMKNTTDAGRALLTAIKAEL